MYRPATEQDLWGWRELRNDPDALFWSGNHAPIPLGEHDAWYTRALCHPNHHLVVYDAGHHVDGYGRLQIHRDAEVSFGVAPGVRRMGIGRGMLNHLEAHARQANIERLIGYVHPSNIPSMRAFARQGYHIETNHRHYEKLVKEL